MFIFQRAQITPKLKLEQPLMTIFQGAAGRVALLFKWGSFGYPKKSIYLIIIYMYIMYLATAIIYFSPPQLSLLIQRDKRITLNSLV